ncbi:killer toxin resistant protein [Coemansia sp. RSA 1086]|nr:killer toxin resistant protein [Coemansia sp. RSA 1086]
MRLFHRCNISHLLVLGGAVVSVAGAGSTPPIRTQLLSGFPAPPLLLEIAESIAAHNQSSFFPFIERLAHEALREQSDGDVYMRATNWIKEDQLLSAPALSLLRLDMSAHVFAPAVVAQFQLYNETVVPEIQSVRDFDLSCMVWAQYKDKQLCSTEALQQLLDSETFYGSTYVEEARVEPQLLPFDHVYPAEDSDKLVVLYADILAPEFADFHQYLKQLADSGNIQYVLRYGPRSAHSQQQPLSLVGYGVELALKSTEYKVIDDRDLNHQSQPESAAKFHEQLGSKLFASEIEPAVKGLGEKQLPSLGIQAAQMVLAADDKLDVLRQLAQDLPRYAHLLSEVPVNSTFAEEIGSTSSRTRDVFAINGMKLSEDRVNPFYIMDHLRKENAIIDGLQTAGLSQSQALNLLLHLDKSDDSQDMSLSFDMREHQAEQKSVLWFNDLEKDRRYAGYAEDINILKWMKGPGMLQPVRKNIVQAIFALDLSATESWITVFEDVVGVVEHGMPMQMGLVPLIDFSATDSASDANLMAKFVLYLRRVFKRRDWQSFMKRTLIGHLRSQNKPKSFVSTVQAAYAEFAKVQLTKDQEQPLQWDEIINANDKWLLTRWQSIAEYCKRLDLSLKTVPASGLVFVNGVQLQLKDGYQQQLLKEYHAQTWNVASALRNNVIDETSDIAEFVYGGRAVSSRNTMVFESDEMPLRILDLSAEATQEWMDTEIEYLSYPSRNATDSSNDETVSVWVIGDFTTLSVRKMAADALAAVKIEPAIRVAFIHAESSKSIEDPEDDRDVDAPQILYQLASAIEDHNDERAEMLDFIAGLLTNADSAEASDWLNQLAQPVSSMAGDAEEQFARNRQMLLQLGALPAESGACNIVANGRILPSLTSFSESAFVLLARHEFRERTGPVFRALADITEDLSDLTLKTTAIVEHGKMQFASDDIFQRQRAAASKRTGFVDLSKDLLYLQFGNSDARFQVQCVVDPLSEQAQKWIPILQTLLTLPEVSVDIWLNPQYKTKELPVSRFYRYLWPSSLEFAANGGSKAALVELTDVPADPLLTLGMDVPPAWLVTAVDSVHDLDNIRLSSVHTADISAIYKLAHILVEGHLLDTHALSPARGLEVQLGTFKRPAITDTIVMANLGYLQLKAGPGVWKFGIRPGRSADIYRMDHIGYGRWDYAAAKQATSEDTQAVLVTSFCGTTIFPLVSKRPGQESEELLQDAPSVAPQSSSKSTGGLWSKFKGAFGAQNNTTATEKPHFDVFAVASGHLYERLMSIMMLSVRNTTQSTIKFWLIENFLSPSFKAFVPHMAQEFDFDYEFVTYKWPHWLHQETEKQRTIWGFKILFLDVLFPLDLDRVIFVDADQIVRADLQELADMDLKGAPYGYTPFCDDRKEIDGYRFWKQGWWRDHLRGKPYHISALYVVDLRRFRQMAAGDRMRGQYQALSRDGNSLANLDQDLPNNMQHIVPIHSLPQEWLWCETWCSDEGLKSAKTIDLCNNPMTKEPKLERARRLLPEWQVFDRKVAEFSQKLAKQGQMEGAQIADAEAITIDLPASEAKVHDEL